MSTYDRLVAANATDGDNESEFVTFNLSSSNWTAEETNDERSINWGMLGLSILIVATAAGNLLVCLAVTWEKRLQNMTNYFLMSLAIADLLVSLLVMPLAMIVELFGRFPLGQSLCVIWATMDVLLCTASIWHMCIMSMDRYFTLRYPIRYGRNKTKKMMVLKITVVWLISFAVSVPLAITGFADYRNVYSEGRCIPSIKNFILYGSVFAFYVPLIIMVVTYTLTIRILKRNRAIMSCLNGNYRHQMLSATITESLNSSAGESVRRPPGAPRYGRVGASSPQQSGYTITSGGLTTVKCSSAESPISPSELRNFMGHNRVSPPKRLPEVLKVNLADEANYLDCNFSPTHQSDAGNRSTNDERISRAESKSNRSSFSSSLRASRSQPVFSRPEEEDPLSEHRSSDSNLTKLQFHSTQSDLVSSDRRSLPRERFLSADDEIFGENDERTPLDRPPIGLRTKSVEDIVERSHSQLENNSYVYLANGRERSLTATSSSSFLTAQGPTDTDGGQSTRRNGRYKSAARGGSPYNQRSVGAGTNRMPPKVTTGRLTSTGTRSSKINPDEIGPGYLAFRLLPAGTRYSDEALRILASQPDFYLPATGPVGSWSLRSPSTDNSPSRSDCHPYVRSRAEHYRRRANTMPQRLSAAGSMAAFTSRSRRTNEEKASKVLGIIFAVFVLFWTPFFTMNIISALCESCMESVTSSMMTMMVWLGYLSSLANPIIYTMFSIAFRTVFYRILTCQYKQAAGCGRRRRTSASSTDQRYFSWTKKPSRDGCLKGFRSKFKFGGL